MLEDTPISTTTPLELSADIPRYLQRLRPNSRLTSPDLNDDYPRSLG